MLKINLRKGLVFGIFILISYPIFSQSYISSPYSSFGLGNLIGDNNDRNKAMGGLGVGIRDYFSVNFRNPASYTAFDSTSFLFEASMSGSYMTLQTTDLNENTTNATLSHLVFGFPVTNRWKTSVGLIPYSSVGYRVIDSELKENIGNVLYSFYGEGGYNDFYWGNALQLSKYLSVGFNATYMFGSIERIQKIDFPDSAYILSSRTNSKISISDVKFDFGAQYARQVGKKLNLVVGATYKPQQELKAKRDFIASSFLGGSNGIDFDTDTVNYYNNDPGIVVMPGGFGVGFSISKGFNWLVGVDYINEKWKDYRSFDISDSLVNSNTLKVGGHYIPDPNSFSYYKRVDYRVGFHYSNSQLELRGDQLTDFGITFGMGLPIRSVLIRGSRSMINLGFEYRNRGTLEKGLIKEKYYMFHLGITIYERWFIKRKYN